MHRAALLVVLVVGIAASGAAAHSDAPATLKVAKTRLGTIIVDGRGRSLYLFTTDRNGSIACVSTLSNCTTLWPPLLTSGTPKAGAGVDPKLLGTVHRTKPAGTQVTYKGHPLYRYVNDTKPGDVEGQGFIDAWYVVSPKGAAIKKH